MTMERGKGKHRLKKLNMTGDKRFGGGCVEIEISTLNEGVPEEDTRFVTCVKYAEYGRSHE